MQKKLGLSADQTNAVGNINMHIVNAMDSMMHNTVDRSVLKNARKQMNMDKDAQLQNVLTEDQYKKYQVFRRTKKTKDDTAQAGYAWTGRKPDGQYRQ
jgi:hypothetical protein